MKVELIWSGTRRVVAAGISVLILAGAPCLGAGQKAQHTGTKVEGFAVVITPQSITLFDKKGREIDLVTDKDYTSLIASAAPVTVWYSTTGGVHHLEDIVYPASGAFIPNNLIRRRINRIAILPHGEAVDNSEGLFTAISTYLTENAKCFVAPPDLVLEVVGRTSGARSSLDAVNPARGDVDMKAYLEPQRALVSKITEATHTDAVLEVTLLRVKADVRGSVASWDDMTEPVASGKARTLSPFAGLQSRGWVDAATADMSLWDKTGKLLWRKRRGFAVLAVQAGVTSRYRPRPLTEVYAKDDAMQRWLADTLGQLATPSDH
jgi:hypothetical protein